MPLAPRAAALAIAAALLPPAPAALAAGDSETGHMLARQWCGGCHVIEPGAYRQQFRLSREGTGTLLPVVRP